MIKFSKKQLSMSLFVLALNTLPLNSFASDQFSEETEGELGNSNSVVINTETKTINFENISENGDNVGRNDTINISDVDILNAIKKNFLNKTLEGGNNPVNLLITRNSPFLKNDVLVMHKAHLPSNLKHLSIKDKDGLVKRIENGFLNGSNILSLYLIGFNNLKEIGFVCVSSCTKLIKFGMIGLCNLTDIKRDFLLFSTKLTFFKATGLRNLTTIGENFLHDHNMVLEKIIITKFKQKFWEKNLPKRIKDLIEQNKTVLLIQNEDQYGDIEERVDYVKEYYTHQLCGLTFLNVGVRIGTDALLLQNNE